MWHSSAVSQSLSGLLSCCLTFPCVAALLCGPHSTAVAQLAPPVEPIACCIVPIEVPHGLTCAANPALLGVIHAPLCQSKGLLARLRNFREIAPRLFPITGLQLGTHKSPPHFQRNNSR